MTRFRRPHLARHAGAVANVSPRPIVLNRIAGMGIPSWGFYLLLILSAAILSGCGSSNVREDYLLHDDQSSGLVAFSIEADFHNPFDWHNTFLAVRFGDLDRSEKHLVILADGSIHANSEWTDPVGRLVYLDLTGGEYEIFGWNTGIDFPEYDKPLYSFIRFSVLPGRVTYIGSIFFDVREDLGAYKFEVIDKSDRDVGLLLTRLPNIEREQVTVKLAEIAE